MLKTVVRNLFLPPAGLVILGLIGVLLLRRRPVAGRLLVAFSLVTLWLLSVPVIADALESLAEPYPAFDLSQPTDAQAIVILGGGGQQRFAPEYGGPAAQPMLLERLAYGAYAARKTGLPILVSGARIEASAMRATLQRNFELQTRWVDDQAGDTFQNARNSAELLRAAGVERILLVTQASQMARAVQEFKAVGLQVQAAPTDLASARGHSLQDYFPTPTGLLHSYLGIYELLGDRMRAFLSFTHLRRH